MGQRKPRGRSPVSSSDDRLVLDKRIVRSNLDIGDRLVDSEKLGPPIVTVQGGPAQTEVIVYTVLRYVLDISAMGAMERAVGEPGGDEFRKAYAELISKPLSEPMVAAAIESMIASGTVTSVSNVKEVLKGIGRRILGFLENGGD